MVKRGFVAVSVGYDNSLFTYANSPGCDSSYFFQGFEDKAKAIFDSTDDKSVVSMAAIDETVIHKEGTNMTKW